MKLTPAMRKYDDVVLTESDAEHFTEMYEQIEAVREGLVD